MQVRAARGRREVSEGAMQVRRARAEWSLSEATVRLFAIHFGVSGEALQVWPARAGPDDPERDALPARQ